MTQIGYHLSLLFGEIALVDVNLTYLERLLLSWVIWERAINHCISVVSILAAFILITSRASYKGTVVLMAVLTRSLRDWDFKALNVSYPAI